MRIATSGLRRTAHSTRSISSPAANSSGNRTVTRTKASASAMIVTVSLAARATAGSSLLSSSKETTVARKAEFRPA